ncbi:DNA helicase UvrD [Candidatus Gottesmanbacteria bacterium]|nr:DNA helicase UvrD [Candidatus Gottesmanbacteria bacterium]
MQVITDLQIHSKYSRAVSPQMTIPFIWQWAKRKGIGLMATGDWTHPLWNREIKANLEETGNGLLKLKNNETMKQWNNGEMGPLFLLATEISSIYSQGGKGRRIHTLIWAPTLDTADKINKELIRRGANLYSDGRPIIGLSSIQVAELVFSIDPKCLIIPAHAWTPWFSMYGSQSGFDSIDECYGQFGENIYAIETGLSSDPSMNWRIKELDNRSIVSFSDAHSGPKLGREATVFELPELSYKNIREAIMKPGMDNSQISQGAKIAFTTEFYPEEGKYHYTGHRDCGVKQTPVETKQKGTTCPVCGRKLTVGVMHRVEELSGRSEEDLKLKTSEIAGTKLKGIVSALFPNRPAFIKLVPLQEIIAEVFGSLPTTQKTQDEYNKLVDNFGSEFKILLETSLEDITKISGPKIADALHKVRIGDIFIDPGYDGVFGKVKIWSEEKKEEDSQKEQMSLF